MGLEASGKIATAQAWIFQTWMELSARGANVRLASEMPLSGLVVALAGTLARDFRPSPGLRVVAVAADGLPHPAADWNILQNARHARFFPGCVFMPHWPQPGLVPRDAGRGTAFVNARFFGDPANLAPGLASPAFRDRLRGQLGIDFRVAAAGEWHDFRQVDCVIAMRPSRRGDLRKPATKLYNAWLAGVPFIGGPDSAYAADGRPGVDYLRCRSAGEVFDALKSLAGPPDLRARLALEGRRAAGAFTRDAIAARWREFLERVDDPCSRRPSGIRRALVRLAISIDSLAH